MIVREARPVDAQAIADLYDVFYNQEWFNLYKNSSLNEFAKYQMCNKIDVKNYSKWLKKISKSNDARVFVLEDNKVVVGFIVGLIHDRDSYWKISGVIDDLYILKDYRSLGFGKKLVSKLLAFFKKSGCKYSKLNVDLLNPVAIKLYKSYGFKETMFKMIKKF